MRLIKQLICAISLVALANIAVAGGYLTNFSSEGVTITKYFVHSNSAITFFVSGTVNSNDCSSGNQVHIRTDTAGRDEMISAVMLAFASGKKIGLYYSRCEVLPFWGGTNTYPIISDLWVIN